MKMVVWKTVLNPTDTQEIDLPLGAQILCAREQKNTICLWFLHDADDARQKRRVIDIIGTGNPIAPIVAGGKYLGTASLHDGELVFHVFERAS